VFGERVRAGESRRGGRRESFGPRALYASMDVLTLAECQRITSGITVCTRKAWGLRAWPANHAFLHRFRTRHVRIHRVRVLPCARCGLHPRTHARTHARTDTVPKHVGAFLQTKQCACAPEHGRAELCRALSHKIAIAYCVSRCVCASSTRCSVRA
jgi:hypothetical protein